MAARLKEQYNSTIVPALKEKFGRENTLSLPRLNKIVVNMGVGSATQEKKTWPMPARRWL
jgi:large subunit ribosomal protein L5